MDKSRGIGWSIDIYEAKDVGRGEKFSHNNPEGIEHRPHLV